MTMLIFNFFKKISNCPGIVINYDIIKKVFNDKFNLDKIQQLIAGIDFRNNLNDSRIKLWFIIKDYPQKLKQVLSVHGSNKTISDLIINNKLLF